MYQFFNALMQYKQKTEINKMTKHLSKEYSTHDFCSIWVFFHEHSRFTGQQGKGEGMYFNSSVPFPPASQTLRHS